MRATVMPYSDRVEVSLDGRFDVSASREFREAIRAALRAGGRELWIDLAAVDYIDSVALGSLLTTREMAEKEGKSVVLAGATGKVRNALDLACLGDMFAMR